MFEARTEMLDCGERGEVPFTTYYAPDGSYIGDKEFADMLESRGIVPQRREPENPVASIGFCEAEQKWYGWSHRAMFGFGVGSSVKRGDCAYTSDNVDELIEDYVNFFADVTDPEITRAKLKRDDENKRVWVGETHYAAPVADNVSDLIEELESPGTLAEGSFSLGGYWMNTGRGAWTAATLDDAKQMACDFAEGVS